MLNLALNIQVDFTGKFILQTPAFKIYIYGTI